MRFKVPMSWSVTKIKAKMMKMKKEYKNVHIKGMGDGKIAIQYSGAKK